ncbi:MAG TPA: ubiquinol-cytochrome c reductase iron-sulfur subunit [Solirubrobacteraceae bacterium]|nr:ubiquinol-cytochrome c reductase iron-sulfur subunit [Solirubrobacteraceae bacterium]
MPERRKPKSKYTLDRNIPGAYEGETVTRRRLMVLGANGVGGVAAAAFTLPALGFALAPVFKVAPNVMWQAVGPPADFTDDNYVVKVITLVPGIGEAGKSIAYVRSRNPAIDTEPEDQYNHWIALSSRCMHLGCPVRWVDAAQRFICPCHGGVYNLRGQVAGGPPVRPLDRFYTRLNTATGLVELGPRYSVNNEFRRFSPRDPAEPLDGIGQYLYPARWSTPPGPTPGLP